MKENRNGNSKDDTAFICLFFSFTPSSVLYFDFDVCVCVCVCVCVFACAFFLVGVRSGSGSLGWCHAELLGLYW